MVDFGFAKKLAQNQFINMWSTLTSESPTLLSVTFPSGEIKALTLNVFQYTWPLLP